MGLFNNFKVDDEANLHEEPAKVETAEAPEATEQPVEPLVDETSELFDLLEQTNEKSVTKPKRVVDRSDQSEDVFNSMMRDIGTLSISINLNGGKGGTPAPEPKPTEPEVDPVSVLEPDREIKPSVGKFVLGDTFVPDEVVGSLEETPKQTKTGGVRSRKSVSRRQLKTEPKPKPEPKPESTPISTKSAIDPLNPPPIKIVEVKGELRFANYTPWSDVINAIDESNIMEVFRVSGTDPSMFPQWKGLLDKAKSRREPSYKAEFVLLGRFTITNEGEVELLSRKVIRPEDRSQDILRSKWI